MGGSQPLIGILALQGDVREHRTMLESLGAEVREIRQPSDLDGIEGLVLPGGESSVIDKLSRIFELRTPLQDLIRKGLPVLATCAGMIMLAKELEDGIAGQQTLGSLDITVRRNAFGAQRESFDTTLEVKGVAGALDVSFIRAPEVTRVGTGVEILASLPGGQVVAVSAGDIVALAFHPEVTGETRLHQRFLDTVRRTKEASP